MPTNIRDPRSIVTPDAFGIDESLLGLPLAGPWRRFWAMMIDLAVIGVLTAALDSIQLFIWGVVALFLLRIAFQRPGGVSQAAAVLMRVFAGCLGLVVLTTVVIVFLVVRSSGGGSDESGPPGLPDLPAAVGEFAEIEGLDALAGLAAFAELDEDATAEEFVELSAEALLRIEDSDGELDEEEAAELLDLVTPDDVAWEEEADSVHAATLARWMTLREEAPEEGDAASGSGSAAGVGSDEATAAAEAEVAALDDRAAVAAWLETLRVDTAGGEGASTVAADPATEARRTALRHRVLALVAADTLDALLDELDDAEDDVDDLEGRVQRLREQLEEERGSFGALLRDVWDQAGSAIGLWSLYFTVLLTLWGGQTVGKKVLGIRVRRLDGEPLNWWASFERGGGYVAGIATGLLGFAQVFWDPNRQCIHDKIVGTVVVYSGRPAVPGAWQEAHAASGVASDDEDAFAGKGGG